MTRKTAGYGLYNTTIVVLKFLLAPLAICVLVFDQLEIRFPSPFAVVDATPQMQSAHDGEFHVAFYGLRIFSRYSKVRVEATAVGRPNGQRFRLDPKVSDRKVPPFYSYDFKLPNSAPQGLYDLDYAVYFDDRRDATPLSRLARAGRSHQIEISGSCYQTLADPYSTWVRQGQETKLPREWGQMRLISTDGRIASVHDRAGSPWIAIGAPPGEHPIRLRSALTVRSIDPNSGRITVAVAGGGQAVVEYDSQTQFRRRCGQGLQPAVGDRLAVSLRSDGKAGSILTSAATSADQTWDIEVRATVLPNLAPRSAYYKDGPGIVTLYANWRLYDLASHRWYFPLGRSVIDPDGQDPATGDPDIRVRYMKLPSQPDRALYDLVETDSDFRLYLTAAGQQVFDRVMQAGEERTVTLQAWDEIGGRPQLTLRILKY